MVQNIDRVGIKWLGGITICAGSSVWGSSTRMEKDGVLNISNDVWDINRNGSSDREHVKLKCDPTACKNIHDGIHHQGDKSKG